MIVNLPKGLTVDMILGQKIKVMSQTDIKKELSLLFNPSVASVTIQQLEGIPIEFIYLAKGSKNYDSFLAETNSYETVIASKIVDKKNILWINASKCSTSTR